MKIAILGAAGMRTPLIVQAMIKRQERISLSELALMDLDAERLELIGALTTPLEHSLKFNLTRTTDARAALHSADFVITTFRVGGIESRVIDERVPLQYGVLGQETTGPGGFAMAMRTIPVLLDYVQLMREVCPQAWLINFANPAGLLVEAVTREAEWQRVVGICDSPNTLRSAAAAIGLPPHEVYLDYFGLNHLGWVKGLIYHSHDYLPQFIAWVHESKQLPDLPFDPDLVAGLGLIPNEYLYYYYDTDTAVKNILQAGQSRGEQIAELNAQLVAELRRLKADGNFDGMLAAYEAYLRQRGSTYMLRETGRPHDLDPASVAALQDEGYAGVALDVIEGLLGVQPRPMILNVPNRGSIDGMADEDVVETPAYVGKDFIRPLTIGAAPDHCLGLMKQVKHYERLTIEAGVGHSYQSAVMALALHPLVPNYATAKAILEEYRAKHGDLFPVLR